VLGRGEPPQDFALVLSAAKALLEHNIILTVVLDHLPKGLEL
jgi:hypothetical protein